MGNNLFSVCKTVNGENSEKSDTNQDQQSQQQQQMLKETEKRKQERKIKTNRSTGGSTVHAKEGQSQDNSIAEKSKGDHNSIDFQQSEGKDGIMQHLINGQEINQGQWMNQHNINSIGNNQDHSNAGSIKKADIGNIVKVNGNSNQGIDNGETNHHPKNTITSATNGQIDQGISEQQQIGDKCEEEAMLKNNNDKYFSKEDLIYYELIRHNTEKKTIVHRDKNIRWQPGEVLGSGSFGQVILGMNIDTGEFMAVKQIHIGGYNQADRKEKMQQIQSEIEALQNFSDKHIVRYIGIKKSDNSINIFLEYVPGGSISSLLYRYKKFNETLIRKFTTQILKGLEYLHSNEIIHRDIKGANVLVDKDGNCKLADFGSAKKIVEEKGHNDSIRGTPYWMAPETIKQVGSGRFADIWSIGCTVIEMATAKPPWADKTPIQAMFYIANATEAPPIPEHLSPECKDFISKCLRIRPSERYNVRQLLNHQFITGIKSTNMGQSSKLLARITEETTLEGQTTSSPDRRKDFSNRMESRGNTLFREEISMTDTKVMSIKSKTFQSNNIRKNSDSDKSIDSLDHPPTKHSLRQINSRNIHNKHLTSGSTLERDEIKDKQQYQDSSKQSSKKQKKHISSNSNISSSSDSSSSSDENKQNGQITSKSLKTNKSQISNNNKKINQVVSLDGQSDNELQTNPGYNHEVISQTKQTQPLLSLFSGRQSIGKHHTVNNLSTDNNEYDDNDRESSTNNFTNQLTARNQQLHTNTSITFKDGTMKRQEKEGSVSSTFKIKWQQQDMMITSKDQEDDEEMSHVRLVQNENEGKVQGKIGDVKELDLSLSSSFSGGDGKEEGIKEEKKMKYQDDIINESQGIQKNKNEDKDKREINQQPVDINGDNDQQQSQQQQQQSIQILKIKPKTTRQQKLSKQSMNNQQSQLPLQISDDDDNNNNNNNNNNQPEDKQSSMHASSSSFRKMESFGTEKFGRFKYNRPTSPKILTQISNGPTLNSCSQDHILLESTKQGCVATSESFLPLKTLNTQKLNQFTGYFNNQEQLTIATATTNSIQDSRFSQTGNTINGNNNYNIRQQPTSIDQHMLQQFQALSMDKQ